MATDPQNMPGRDDISLSQIGASVLNAISAQVAVIDENGNIIAVNTAWNEFARENGDPELKYTGVGTNYFDVCYAADGEEMSAAQMVLKNMLDILNGKADHFETEYPCHSPTEKRWFLLEIFSLSYKNKRFLIVSHSNITRWKIKEQNRVAREVHVTRVQQYQDEIKILKSIPNQKTLAVSRGLFGTPPLKSTLPDTFEEFIQSFETLIKLALEQRIYKVEHDISHELQLMAENLGLLKARPRDVVDVYLMALNRQQEQQKPQKFQAYADEARIILLELMGYLASFYRTYAFGSSSGKKPEKHDE